MTKQRLSIRVGDEVDGLRRNRTSLAVVQQASASQSPLNLSRFCLLIMTLLGVLVGMNWWQINRLRARSEFRKENLGRITDTTLQIESSAWQIRFWGIRNLGKLPSKLSEVAADQVDGWGRPLRITQEGDSTRGYKISSAGADGEFDTEDDIAIRFSMDHNEVERLNTYGREEMNAQTDLLMQSLGIDSNEQ